MRLSSSSYARVVRYLFFAFAALLPVSNAAADFALFPLLILGLAAPLWHLRGYEFRGSYVVPVVLFVLVVVTSVFWGLNPSATLGKLHRLAFLLLIFQAPAFLGEDKEGAGWRWAGVFLIFGSAVRGLYDSGIIVWTAIQGESIYDAGSMINPQFFMVALCLLAAGWLPGKFGRCPVSLPAWVLNLSGWILHFKRGVWLATLISLGWLTLWRRKWKRLIPVPILIACVLFVPQVRDRLAQLPEEFASQQGGRWALWTEAFPALIARHPTGIGWHVTEYEHLAEHVSYLQQNLDHMHNNILQITLELGYQGITVWLVWMGWTLAIFFMIVRRLRLRQDPAAIPFAGLLAAFIGLLLNGMVESNFNTGSIMRLYCLLMGLMLCFKQEMLPTDDKAAGTGMGGTENLPGQ